MKYVIPTLATISGLTWDIDMTIPTGMHITSVDTSGTVGSNLSGQLSSVLGGVL